MGVAAIIACVVGFQFGDLVAKLLLRYGEDFPRLMTLSESNTADAMLLGIGAASLLGIVGWVISIVATVKRSGRAFSIAGIVLGVLAPIAMFLAFYQGAIAYLS